MIVADIDLIRYQGEEIREIIELKRSYIDIEKWEPYKQDYKNFILLSKLARRRELDFLLSIITVQRRRFLMMFPK